MQSLFNYRIAECGVIYHNCRGCCSSPSETKRMMKKEGVDALLPRNFIVMQRPDWTGMLESLQQFGIGSAVHGIALQGLALHAMKCNAVQYTDTTPNIHPCPQFMKRADRNMCVWICTDPTL